MADSDYLNEYAQALAQRRQQFYTDSPFYAAGQGVLKTPLELGEDTNPWESILAQVAQGLIGGALSGYGEKNAQANIQDFNNQLYQAQSSPDPIAAFQQNKLLQPLASSLEADKLQRQREIETKILDEQIKNPYRTPNFNVNVNPFGGSSLQPMQGQGGQGAPMGGGFQQSQYGAPAQQYGMPEQQLQNMPEGGSPLRQQMQQRVQELRMQGYEDKDAFEMAKSEFEPEQGILAETFKDANTKAIAAKDIAQVAEQIKNSIGVLQKEGVDIGSPTVQLGMGANRFRRTFMGDTKADRVTNAYDAIQAGMNKLTLEQTQLLKGALSNKELDFVSQIIPGIGKSNYLAKEMSQGLIEGSKNATARLEFLGWYKNHGDPTTAEAAWNAYLDATPVWTTNEETGQIKANTNRPTWKQFFGLSQNKGKQGGGVNLGEELNPQLVNAVISAESAGNPRAVSPKGAKGMMQLMDATGREQLVKSGGRAEEYDPFNPQQNVQLGTSYLQEQMKTFQGNTPLALAAYNAGPGRVQQAIQKAGTTDIKEVIKYLPQETQQYVAQIMRRTG